MNLLKYKSLTKISEIEDLLVSEKIYLSKINELNDPYEKYFNQRELPMSTWERIDDLPSLITTDARVFCVSSGDPIKNRKKMWNTYAQNGSGICIIFSCLNPNVPPLPIRYVAASEFQNMLSNNENGNFFYIKENIWAHEAEYRFSISGSETSLNRSDYRDFALFGLKIEKILFTTLTKKHENFHFFQEICKKKDIILEEVCINCE